MLSEITAITQLVLVLEVAYLMAHCRQFKRGVPAVLEDMEYRDDRTRSAYENIVSIMDEIADGLLSGEVAETHAPLDLKSMLTAFLMSKAQMAVADGSQTEREIQIEDSPQELQTET